MNPDGGSYYYGRGNVHFLAGNKELAMSDFERAADLGDRDAKDFLEQSIRREVVPSN
jgi:hypothetical protein